MASGGLPHSEGGEGRIDPVGIPAQMLANIRSPAWLLVPLIVAAVFLRRVGLEFELPATTLDGSVVVAQTEQIRNYHPGERGGPLWQYYPLLLAQVAAVMPFEDPAPVQLASGEAWPTEDHIRLASATWIRIRRTSLWLGVLLIPAVYLLARRFVGPWTALLAAALTSTSLVHLHIGTLVRPHATAATSMACALLLALWLRRRATLLRYGLGGLGAGLALGSLHYGLFALPASGLAGLLARGASKARKALGFGLALFLIALCVRWLYPFHFAGNEEFLSMDSGNLDLSGQPLKLSRFDGSGFRRLAIYLWSYDPTLFVCGIMGLASLSVRFLQGQRLGAEMRLDAWVVAACYGPYLLVIGMYAESWERFLLPLLPILALVAAVGIASLVGRVRVVSLRAVLACAVLVFPLFLQARLVRLRSGETTLQEASRAVAELLHSRRDRLALLSYHDLDLAYHPRALRENREEAFGSMWVRYQRKLPPEQRSKQGHMVLLPQGSVGQLKDVFERDVFEYLESIQADYVLIPVDPLGEIAQLRRKVRAQLRARLEPIWSTSARESSEFAALPYQMVRQLDWSHSFVSAVLSSRVLGESFELYKLPAKAAQTK